MSTASGIGLTVVLALLGIGAQVGQTEQGFQLNAWAIFFWACAALVALVTWGIPWIAERTSGPVVFDLESPVTGQRDSIGRPAPAAPRADDNAAPAPVAVKQEEPRPPRMGVTFRLVEAHGGLSMVIESFVAEAISSLQVWVRDIRRRSDQRSDLFAQTKELHQFTQVGVAMVPQLFHGEPVQFPLIRSEDNFKRLVLVGPKAVLITVGGVYRISLMWNGLPGSGGAEVQFEWNPGDAPTRWPPPPLFTERAGGLE